MSKYDFEIDLSQNSSTGIILNKIGKGSAVLEFGCATGRMTRYMKEVLGCKVYIVEYDKSAYETALQYAEDGLCDDILTFRWTEKFAGMKFDAILFADVLEHLTLPEKVLARASEFLKDTGCLYASIPNVTHNDILLKAWGEHFDYTPTGLLDDTHVHFWGLKNIEKLSDSCGLTVRTIEGTYCATGCSEQNPQADTREQVLLRNILKERQCGEVYQFVVTFDKNPEPGTVCTIQAPAVKSHIYLDTGNDFNAEEIIGFRSEYSGQGSYTAHYEISSPGKIKRIRFDPIEFQGCILRHVSIRQGEEKLPLHYHNAVEMDEGILLMGTDPMVYTDALPTDDPVVIDADIVVAGETYIQILQEAFAGQHAAFGSFREETAAQNRELQAQTARLNGQEEALRAQIAGLNGQTEALQAQIAGLNGQTEALQAQIAGLSGENGALRKALDERRSEIGRLRGTVSGLTARSRELQAETTRLSGENEELRRDVGAYIVLANKKDQYALALEQKLKASEQESEALKRELEDLRQKLEDVKKLRIIKLLRPRIVRFLKGVKRWLKRVISAR